MSRDTSAPGGRTSSGLLKLFVTARFSLAVLPLVLFCGTTPYHAIVSNEEPLVTLKFTTSNATVTAHFSYYIQWNNFIKLSNALRKKFGEEKGIRCPSPSISLLLIGIEDSVNADELKSTLEAHDKELIAANKLTIREGFNGVRTATVRVPLAPGLRLVQAKKIKVGRAICRVKELVTKQGCAKCSAPYHATADCTGTTYFSIPIYIYIYISIYIG
ncbi:hypothetical protein AGLY_000819 [Aphis glycines]|uniref:Uncharacterized protein n=1 Tax=Aphis glycines TaxID=307491 RepID=A0A6G0UAK8_APHGL|nr:hypothetical protein AGLY_000819 [Aphis glycines]